MPAPKGNDQSQGADQPGSMAKHRRGGPGPKHFSYCEIPVLANDSPENRLEAESRHASELPAPSNHAHLQRHSQSTMTPRSRPSPGGRHVGFTRISMR